jgi:hypothetical protein
VQLDPGQLDPVGDVVDQGAGQALARVEVGRRQAAAAVAGGRVKVRVVAVAGPVEQELLAAAEGAALGAGVLDLERDQAELPQCLAAPQPLADRAGAAVDRADHELELAVAHRSPSPAGPGSARRPASPTALATASTPAATASRRPHRRRRGGAVQPGRATVPRRRRGRGGAARGTVGAGAPARGRVWAGATAASGSSRRRTARAGGGGPGPCAHRSAAGSAGARWPARGPHGRSPGGA